MGRTFRAAQACQLCHLGNMFNGNGLRLPICSQPFLRSLEYVFPPVPPPPEILLRHVELFQYYLL